MQDAGLEAGSDSVGTSKQWMEGMEQLEAMEEEAWVSFSGTVCSIRKIHSESTASSLLYVTWYSLIPIPVDCRAEVLPEQ